MLAATLEQVASGLGNELAYTGPCVLPPRGLM
jgi:hypothetical protein